MMAPWQLDCPPAWTGDRSSLEQPRQAAYELPTLQLHPMTCEGAHIIYYTLERNHVLKWYALRNTSSDAAQLRLSRPPAE